MKLKVNFPKVTSPVGIIKTEYAIELHQTSRVSTILEATNPIDTVARDFAFQTAKQYIRTHVSREGDMYWLFLIKREHMTNGDIWETKKLECTIVREWD